MPAGVRFVNGVPRGQPMVILDGTSRPFVVIYSHIRIVASRRRLDTRGKAFPSGLSQEHDGYVQANVKGVHEKRSSAAHARPFSIFANYGTLHSWWKRSAMTKMSFLLWIMRKWS